MSSPSPAAGIPLANLPPAAGDLPVLNLNNPADQEVALEVLNEAYSQVVNDLGTFNEECQDLLVENSRLRHYNKWLKNGILIAGLVVVGMTAGYVVGMLGNWN